MMISFLPKYRLFLFQKLSAWALSSDKFQSLEARRPWFSNHWKSALIVRLWDKFDGRAVS